MRAVVVIADQQVIRHRELVELVLQRRVGLRFALVGKVAGEDRESRVGVIAIDVGNTERQPVDGIQAIEQIARRHEVGVGDVDELLHGRTL